MTREYAIEVLNTKQEWTEFATTTELFRAQFIKDALLKDKAPDHYRQGEVRIVEKIKEE